MAEVTWNSLGVNTRSASSGEIDTECPWCSSQRKKKHARCLSVNLDKGVYHCAHCGVSGGLSTDRRSYEVAWRKPVYRLPDPPKEVTPVDPVVAWFETRGISREVVERNKIFGTKLYMPQTESVRSVVAFPYYRNGTVINYKYRTRDKLFRMEAQAERILYGYDDIHDEICILVEGEIDKLSIESAGLTRSCVSVPDGAPTPNTRNYASKFTFLDDERLQRVKEWVIAVDNDPAGVRLEQELVRRLGVEKCRKVVWPDGCKDANDVLMQHGKEKLADILAHARPYPVEGVIEVRDLSPQLDALYWDGLKRGLLTGSRSLDELYTVRAGEWTVVTGTPGSGKSNFVDWLCVNLAKSNDWRFGVFSPENQPLQGHIARIIEHYAGLPFRAGPTPRMSHEQMALARDWTHEYFKFILPDDDTDWRLDNIIETAGRLVRRYGINGLIVDPWNELEHSRPDSLSETEYISRSLKKFRQFCRKSAVHGFLIAHPTKLYRSKDTGQYPVPTLYDIAGSAHFRNKADNGLVVWRDFNNPANPVVEIHTQKIRFREVGKLGKCSLRYIQATGSYEDLPSNNIPTHASGWIEDDDEAPPPF